MTVRNLRTPLKDKTRNFDNKIERVRRSRVKTAAVNCVRDPQKKSFYHLDCRCWIYLCVLTGCMNVVNTDVIVRICSYTSIYRY